MGFPHEKAKVRFVTQGYKNNYNSYVFHDTSTLRASSIRLVLSVVAILHILLCSHDVTQAYLQSKYEPMRRIFIQPKLGEMKTFRVGNDEILELVKPLYTICKPNDNCSFAVDEHVVNNLDRFPIAGDAALYVERNEKRGTIGVTGTYVDDSLNAGTNQFEQMTELTL